jgi:hypothetical protein
MDGRVLFQGTLKKGRTVSWQAKDRIELTLGNAGMVELEVNGRHFANLGRRSQAVRLSITRKDGLRILK